MSEKDVSRGKKYLKYAVALVGTIVLGAVGSGVWERLGSKFFDWIARSIITFVNALIGTYKDSIYREAALGFNEQAASMLYLIVLGAMVGGCFGFTVARWHRHQDSRANSRASTVSRTPWPRVLLYLSLVFVASNSAINASRHIYVREIVVYVYSSIDRLAPFLTDAEEEELLAQFRNVRGSEDYYAFYDRLLETYEAHGLDPRGRPPL